MTECINAMYTGEMTVLSEQQLIDCDHAKPFEDIGCAGGDFTGEGCWRCRATRCGCCRKTH
jgi:hypothetical protein